MPVTDLPTNKKCVSTHMKKRKKLTDEKGGKNRESEKSANAKWIFQDARYNMHRTFDEWFAKIV